MTSTGTDVLVLVVALALCAVVLLGATLERALVTVRPPLPVQDRPPAGLSRLLPVGVQVDREAACGLHALDLWLRGLRARP